jgi:multiple sugar transport system ATP-binding protein
LIEVADLGGPSREEAVSEIVLDGVGKVFEGGVRAITDVNLEITSGEFMVLVGPSGCGKSTLLRMIAGLEEVTEGSVSIGGRDVTHLQPRDRDIAMVFQNYALYPHMSVRDNLGYGLRVRRTPKEEIARRVGDVARILGLEDYLERKPANLSGGQRQRVAMGRAMVREPVAYLMDEPLSNLDAKLRVGMRAELSRLHARLGVTTVYVTHDQVEAMTLGQRVAVLRDGRIQQVDTPQNLYREPDNLFVAAFIGSPSMNLVDARIADGFAEFAEFRIPLHPERSPVGVRGDRVILGIRPDAFEDARYSEADLAEMEVTVSVLEELGSEAHLIFSIDAPKVSVEDVKVAADTEDEAALLAEDADKAQFVARVDPRTSGRVGERVRLTVDPSRFHFFDPDSGESLTRSALAGAPA